MTIRLRFVHGRDPESDAIIFDTGGLFSHVECVKRYHVDARRPLPTSSIRATTNGDRENASDGACRSRKGRARGQGI